MENQTNALTLFSTSASDVFSSKEVKTLDDKKALFNALESCDVLLNDCVDKVIKIKDVYCEKQEVTDEETGEVRPKYRTILFDVDGKTYATGSYGIYNVIKKLIAIYGLPTWEEGLKVKVIKQKVKDGKSKLSLTIE